MSSAFQTPVTVDTSFGGTLSIEIGLVGVTLYAVEYEVVTPLSEVNLAFTHLELKFCVIIFAGFTTPKYDLI